MQSNSETTSCFFKFHSEKPMAVVDNAWSKMREIDILNDFNQGDLVDIVIKEGAIFNTETRTIETFHAPEEETGKSSEFKVGGYVVERTPEYVMVAAGFDTKKNKIAKNGYISPTQVDKGAIFSYQNLAKYLGPGISVGF